MTVFSVPIIQIDVKHQSPHETMIAALLLPSIVVVFPLVIVKRRHCNPMAGSRLIFERKLGTHEPSVQISSSKTETQQLVCQHCWVFHDYLNLLCLKHYAKEQFHS